MLQEVSSNFYLPVPTDVPGALGTCLLAMEATCEAAWEVQLRHTDEAKRSEAAYPECEDDVGDAIRAVVQGMLPVAESS